MKNAKIFFTLKFIFPMLFVLAVNGAFSLETKVATFTVLSNADNVADNLREVPGVATHFTVVAATPVMSGVPLPVIVTAYDSSGNVVTDYNGTIHFTSSDGAANLPGDYTFFPGDFGSRQFSPRLNTLGNQTITVTDTANATITGTSNTITVQPSSSNLIVTRTDDRNQACSIGDCSLREAVNAANALPSDDTINFDPVVFATPQSIELTVYGTPIRVFNNGKLTINGAGKVTLTGETFGVRAIEVDVAADLTINELTIDRIRGDSSAGGILNFRGTLTINNSTISNNQGGASPGIGIQNMQGVLTVNNSTISGNLGQFFVLNSANGGGIYNRGGQRRSGTRRSRLITYMLAVVVAASEAAFTMNPAAAR